MYTPLVILDVVSRPPIVTALGQTSITSAVDGEFHVFFHERRSPSLIRLGMQSSAALLTFRYTSGNAVVRPFLLK